VNRTWHHACVQVQEDVWQKLKETADRKGVSVSDVIRDAINAYLFIGFDSPPKTDIEQAEKAIVLILELLKRSLG
jgi:metal-responsive CopG/Arc/MetJ family transcriptional regulator